MRKGHESGYHRVRRRKMGKIFKKLIFIFFVIIICAIFIPTLLLPYSKIFQIENGSVKRMRPISQWDFEYVLNGTVFREFENAIDEQLNKKENFGRLYGYIQQFVNKNMTNCSIVENSVYTHFYYFILDKKYIDNMNTTSRELKGNKQELGYGILPINHFTQNAIEAIQYFKEHHQIKVDSIYIAYKVMLDKMNDKNLNNNLLILDIIV